MTAVRSAAARSSRYSIVRNATKSIVPQRLPQFSRERKLIDELDTSTDTTEAGVWKAGSPSGSAMLVVKRGPNRIAIPAGSAGYIGRAASRQRHLPRRRQRQPTARRVSTGNRRIPGRGPGSLNGTYVNRTPVESVESVVLANGDEIQMGKFRLVFVTRPTTH